MRPRVRSSALACLVVLSWLGVDGQQADLVVIDRCLGDRSTEGIRARQRASRQVGSVRTELVGGRIRGGAGGAAICAAARGAACVERFNEGRSRGRAAPDAARNQFHDWTKEAADCARRVSRDLEGKTPRAHRVTHEPEADFESIQPAIYPVHRVWPSGTVQGCS